MKKFLLSTTALISMTAASAALAGGSHAPAAAAPANTGGLTVMVGGNINVQSAFIGQDESVVTTALGNNESADHEFRNDTTVNITAAGSTDDFDYGAVIEMEADTSEDKNETSVNNSDKTYVYLENDSFGRFEMGATAGVSQTMEVDASNIARGTGGVDGDSQFGVDYPSTQTAIESPRIAPNLVLAETDNRAPDFNKITYYTPRFSGVQLGVSYAPDSTDSGTAAATGDDIEGQFENAISAGINFESDIADGVGMTAAVVGEWANRQDTTFGTPATLNDLAAYSVGLGFEFEGFSVAGNWADLGDTNNLMTDTLNDEGSYWTLGAAYENGPYGVSVTYLESEQGTGAASGAGVNTGEHEFNNLVVGADYQMAPGLVPYVEASFFERDNGSTDSLFDNDGNTVLVGANLAF